MQKVFDMVREISRIRSTPSGQSSLRRREDKLCGRFKEFECDEVHSSKEASFKLA